MAGAEGGTQPVAACWRRGQAGAQAGREARRREPDWAVVGVRWVRRRVEVRRRVGRVSIVGEWDVWELWGLWC